jgi:hypothetical protein
MKYSLILPLKHFPRCSESILYVAHDTKHLFMQNNIVVYLPCGRDRIYYSAWFMRERQRERFPQKCF